MSQPVFITGQAGTGKTTMLLNEIAGFCSRLLPQEHQRMLAMAVMHGARRRLVDSLDGHEQCRTLRRSVSTIDSFALTLVNRWRSSLGIDLPIAASKDASDTLAEQYFRTNASFTRVIQLCLTLLQRQDVREFVRGTYPLIAIDEFQDCHSERLALIRELAELTQIIFAADGFQFLETNIAGCPALEWIEGLRQGNAVEYRDLTQPRRTANPNILEAARCLRGNIPASHRTVPVLFGPHGMIAWKILERLVFGNKTEPRWQGTCALVCPSRDPVVNAVLQSLENQLTKKNIKPLRWSLQSSPEEDEAALLKGLGITADTSTVSWPGVTSTNPDVLEVMRQATEFAKLRGLPTIPSDLVAIFARKYIHRTHSYSFSSSRYVVTTVHGAKNREFDNVFVLWPYRLVGDTELQRRLLYNAVTRAKKNCIVFDARQKDAFRSDPVIGLLGKAQSLTARTRK